MQSAGGQYIIGKKIKLRPDGQRPEALEKNGRYKKLDNFYKAGSNRQVEGRDGIVCVEEDIVDEMNVENRYPEE